MKLVYTETKMMKFKDVRVYGIKKYIEWRENVAGNFDWLRKWISFDLLATRREVNSQW